MVERLNEGGYHILKSSGRPLEDLIGGSREEGRCEEEGRSRAAHRPTDQGRRVPEGGMVKVAVRGSERSI